MAAPLLVLSLPAIFTALWTGIVAIVKWALEHAHIVKIVVVCLLIVSAFKMGTFMFNTLMTLLENYSSSISNSYPSAVSASLEIMAKANYCLPLTEALVFLSIYVTLAGLCIGLRFTISLYRSIPFKSA